MNKQSGEAPAAPFGYAREHGLGHVRRGVAGAHLTHSGIGVVTDISGVFTWIPFKIDGNLLVQICTSSQDHDIAIAFRQKHFFDAREIQDPYTWTVGHKNHRHFLLYKDQKAIGYAHIQYWKVHRAALRIIVIDEQNQGKGYGAYLMKFCEQVLKDEGIQILQTEASPTAVPFYERLGYSKMPFNDPDGHPTDPKDTPMGKYL